MNERLESFLIDNSDLILRDYAADIRWHYYSQKDPHEADFSLFSNFPDSTEVFLDIGASIGLSVASFRLFNRGGKVISFEPCSWLEPALLWLKREEGARFDYFMVGAGHISTTLDLYIPCLDKVPIFYLASFVSSRFGPEAEVVEAMRKLMGADSSGTYNVCKIPIEVKPVDEFDLSPTLIKIDTECFELQVLQGLRKTISKHRPLIMIEGANRDKDVVSFFSDNNYVYAERTEKKLMLFDKVSNSVNGFFLAYEKISEYRKRGALI